MTMVEVAKEVAKNPLGKKVLINIGLATAGALIVPLILKPYRSIVMIAEIFCCVVISINVDKFSRMLLAAEQFFDEEEKKKK